MAYAQVVKLLVALELMPLEDISEDAHCGGPRCPQTIHCATMSMACWLVRSVYSDGSRLLLIHGPHSD